MAMTENPVPHYPAQAAEVPRTEMVGMSPTVSQTEMARIMSELEQAVLELRIQVENVENNTAVVTAEVPHAGEEAVPAPETTSALTHNIAMQTVELRDLTARLRRLNSLIVL